MCRRPRETQCCAHVLQVCYVGLVGSVSFWHTVKALGASSMGQFPKRQVRTNMTNARADL